VEFQQYLKPWLLQQVSRDWPDPRKAKNKEKMLLDYTFSYGAAELGKILFQFLDGQEGEIKRIDKLIKQRNADQDDSPGALGRE
jgi:hypothetical protein